eukprot:GEMP01058360.1.p1 GENE.GEMP01058360.1~~GEMP01058360.1.p1  ORF type:complete len:109 (-),score=3.99 GEMP01058360.1:1116-1442(-)
MRRDNKNLMAPHLQNNKYPKLFCSPAPLFSKRLSACYFRGSHYSILVLSTLTLNWEKQKGAFAYTKNKTERDRVDATFAGAPLYWGVATLAPPPGAPGKPSPPTKGAG